VVLDDKGDLIAADARIDIDSDALYRHPDIREMKSSHDLNIEDSLRDEYQLEYVELDGNIGLISGGTGLTMTAMDFITLEGGRTPRSTSLSHPYRQPLLSVSHSS
jgi:succinyl-CoA synthetase beta subunit